MILQHVLLVVLITDAMSSLTLHVSTFNTGDTVPTEGLGVAPFLGLEHDPDVISAGFEELGDTDAWEDAVDLVLSKRGYYRVKLETMSIMQIVIFAKKKHLPFLSHIETEYTKTGFGGTYGNKGGTSVRFRLYDKTVAIINSHLSAHMDQVQLRDEEYWNIMSEQDFQDPLSEHLYDHDYLIWSGDLNYRIEHVNAQVRQSIAEGKHLDLLQYDQLRQEQSAGHAFIGFHEAEITFPPTYKFDPGTDIYDTSVKNRTPSWCDRVLWRIKEEREEIVRALNWGSGDGDTDSLDSLSLSLSDLSDGAAGVEVDGLCVSKQKKKKTKKKEEEEDVSEESSLEKLRRQTASLMKKTAVYASTTGSAILRTATGTADIKIHRADVADPERFKNLMSTLEREKVSIVKEKYESRVRAVYYKSLVEYKQSDHKPVVALLELGMDTSLEPRIAFTQEAFTWNQGDKLELSFRVKQGAPTSSWDWIALVQTNWTDTNKHYITYQWVPSGKNTVKFPWDAHPGATKTLQVVYCSSKMSAPVAIADVACIGFK